MGEYLGFDVSKEETVFCVKAAEGEVLAQGTPAIDPQALFEVLKAHCLCPERIVMETRTLSGSLARGLGALGIVVHVTDVRQAHGGAAGSVQQDRFSRMREVLPADRALGLLPCCCGEERGGAGGPGSLVGAVSTWWVIGAIRRTRFGVFWARWACDFAKRSVELARHVRVVLEDHPELDPAIEPLLSSLWRA